VGERERGREREREGERENFSFFICYLSFVIEENYVIHLFNDK
jgi:hypothetical protein